MASEQPSITILTFKYRTRDGKSRYTAQHVNALRSMLAKHLTIPHRLLCITDDPQGVQCDTMPMWQTEPVALSGGRPDNFRRLLAFDEDFQRGLGTEWVAQIDLDVVIRANIDHLFRDRSDFTILTGTRSPETGRRVCGYNGSFWLCRAGARHTFAQSYAPQRMGKILRDVKIDGGQLVGSDQAWLWHTTPCEDVYTEADGIAQYTSGRWQDAAVVFFAGQRKPWDVAGECPALYLEWLSHAGIGVAA